MAGSSVATAPAPASSGSVANFVGV
jgi:hypothetical protein